MLLIDLYGGFCFILLTHGNHTPCHFGHFILLSFRAEPFFKYSPVIPSEVEESRGNVRDGSI